jgi:hypothetical protein
MPRAFADQNSSGTRPWQSQSKCIPEARPSSAVFLNRDLRGQVYVRAMEEKGTLKIMSRSRLLWSRRKGQVYYVTAMKCED